jgi:hypothetical protein
MRDRSEDVRIKSCIPSQLLGVYLVALPVTMRDRPQLTDVRYDDLMSKFLKLLADPDRMGPGCLRETSAMRCCDVFFMGNSLLLAEDLLIPFASTHVCSDAGRMGEHPEARLRWGRYLPCRRLTLG